MKALNLDQEVEFESLLDTAEEKTVWVLKPLDGMVMNHVGVGALRGESGAIIEAVRFGLADVRGFLDADGRPVPLCRESVKLAGGRYGAVSYEFLRRVPGPVLWELSQKIMALSAMGAGEEKNSESQPGSSAPEPSTITDARSADPTPADSSAAIEG